MRSIRLGALSFALAAFSPRASAQAPVPAPADASSNARKPFVLGLTANAISIDPATAAGQRVAARSWGLQFDAGISFARFLYAGIDVAPNRLSDRAGFTQATTAGDKSSSAMLLYFSGVLGARTPAVHVIAGLPAASFGLSAGASITTGERSISECVDCTTESIDIPGGPFVQPTLLLGEGSTRIRVSDRYFLGGKGMRSVISLGLEFGGR